MENISRLDLLRKSIELTDPLTPIIGGGHAQTLLGHFLPGRSNRLPAETHKIDLSDGDCLVGHSYESPIPTESPDHKGQLHIFHGIAGDVTSRYMTRSAHAALRAGFTPFIWNHRGCGEGRRLALEPYHSGRSDDMARIVKWARARTPSSRQGVLGFSLSANAGCLLAAGVAPVRQKTPLSEAEWSKIGGERPDFVIAINPPFDLKRAASRLSHTAARLYGSRFMVDLLGLLDDRIAMASTRSLASRSEGQQALIDLATAARQQLSVFSSVKKFDELFTAPAGGFVTNERYYADASCGQYLSAVDIPLVILSADDDPITHGFADLSALNSQISPWIVVDRQTAGGHMGYVDFETVRRRLTSDQAGWLEVRIAKYLDRL